MSNRIRPPNHGNDWSCQKITAFISPTEKSRIQTRQKKQAFWMKAIHYTSLPISRSARSTSILIFPEANRQLPHRHMAFLLS
ncbi:hypothetical protein IRJ41_022711 [Triplophysa rosa]|uniref:Uncharacterized protein n=1 Tax=Triplophysa rosa TaxID=992332 RepID=A0A9W8C2H3_TRIRA|nr:hypothetical protein IRJ41_022711 [Triplophysa rosa]